MPEYKSTVYILSNAIAVSSIRDVVGASALLSETINDEVAAASYQKVTSFQSSFYRVRKVSPEDVYIDSNAAASPHVVEPMPDILSYQKVTSYQASLYQTRKVLQGFTHICSNAVVNSYIVEKTSVNSYQKVTSYQASLYTIRNALVEFTYLDSNAVANTSVIDKLSVDSYQKVTSYSLSTHNIRRAIYTPIVIDSNAVANPVIAIKPPVDSYQKVTSYSLSIYGLRHAIYTPIVIDSNALANPVIAIKPPVDSYQKVTSYSLSTSNLRLAIYTPIVIDSNAVANPVIAIKPQADSYQKVTSYSDSTYYILDIQQTSPWVESNALVNPGLISIFELNLLSNGVATCVVEDTKIYFSTDMLVKSYPYLTITDRPIPLADLIIVSNATANYSGGERQSFSANQRSGSGFTLTEHTNISFSADQSDSSEMVYARYDEALSFSCGQFTGAVFVFTYIDYNTNLPSMYYGNPSFEVTNVLGKWKKVIGMDTLLNIGHGISAKAMVKAFSSCPEEAISVRFKIASERSSPTGYFVLDDDGTWSPDNMSVTVFVDDPGWYKLEWYVKVGRGARMDWIRLSGATISHS